MSKLELKIRRMQTGETLVAELDSVEEAKAWLAQRPPFIEVVRLLSTVSDEVGQALREATRPLDEHERALQREQDDAAEAARRAELVRLQAEAEAESEAARADGSSLDREMNLRFERGKGLRIDEEAEEGDDRPITPAAHRAAIAWLRERDSWVHARRQHLSVATLRVWPGSVPTGNESDRVIDGEFAAMPGFSDDEIA